MNCDRKITGVVLAGGESRRMGKDKSRILFREKPLIEHPINLLKKFCSEIIISADPCKYPEYNCRKVPDEVRGNGPLSGVLACLKAADFEECLVVSCDMPFLSENLIEHIINNANGYDLLMPFHGEHYEPLCAVYSKALIPVIENQFSKGDYGPLSLIPITKFKKLSLDLSLDFYNEKLFFNINTIEDLNTEMKE